MWGELHPDRKEHSRCDADDAGTGDDDDDELDAVELWCYLDTMSNMP